MHTLWEIGLGNAVVAGLLALPAAAVSRLGRRPALAHGLWLLVFLKLLTPFALPVSLPVPAFWPEGGAAAEMGQKATTAEEPTVVVYTSGPPVGEVPSPPTESVPPADSQPAPQRRADAALLTRNRAAWELVLGGLWLCGAMAWFGWAGWHVCRFQKLLRHARPAPGPLQARVGELAGRLGLRRSPAVWLLPGAVSPMVWALGPAPRLLFPARLLEVLDGSQQDAILVHELAHVRRRDHWVRLVELGASGLYWWNPILWWARRELHEAEEQCCDAWVGWALGGDGRAYALALVQTVAFVSHARLPLSAAASGAGHFSHLRRRLTMIMQTPAPRSLSWAGWLVVGSCALLLLPFLPAEAQQVYPPGDARDEQIQALKQAITILESQKLGDHAQKGADEAETKKLRAEAERLGKEIKARAQELQKLQAKQQEVLQKLGVRGGWFSIQEAPIAHYVPNVHYAPVTTYPNAAYGVFQARPGVSATPLPAPPMFNQAIPTPRAGAGNLEQRLDRLAKELEELRRELKREKPGKRSRVMPPATSPPDSPSAATAPYNTPLVTPPAAPPPSPVAPAAAPPALIPPEPPSSAPSKLSGVGKR